MKGNSLPVPCPARNPHRTSTPTVAHSKNTTFMDTKERNPSCLTQPPPENHAGARNPEHPNISLFTRRTSVLIILIKIPAPIIQHLYREKQKGPDYFRNQGPYQKKAATYSPALHCSTIGATGLNFSVRNGKRWNPGAMTTRKIRRRAGMHAVRVTVTRARDTG